jgi:hypothetical protein
MWSNLYRSRMPDETTRADDRRAWTDEINRDTLRETDGHGTKENKVGVCMIAEKVELNLQGVDQRSAIKATPFSIALELKGAPLFP